MPSSHRLVTDGAAQRLNAVVERGLPTRTAGRCRPHLIQRIRRGDRQSGQCLLRYAIEDGPLYQGVHRDGGTVVCDEAEAVQRA